ncbi:hypothetical protein HNR07_001138 [Nocardiopsis metallicus]|uniref:Uncharacterized protein n=1 Tax=Nocardiopsis metallicus TaxID=179819 RepID=A0A840WAD1_9ACTN|nr:hypothetical protein [Nocardiopsis metallicus]
MDEREDLARRTGWPTWPGRPTSPRSRPTLGRSRP